MKKFYAQVVGMGAGIGIALAADMRRQLPDLLTRGFLWLDANPLGTGSAIKRFCIISNSPSGDYCEVVRPAGHFARALDSPAGKWLLEQPASSQVPLRRVGEYIGEHQRQLGALVADFPQSEIKIGVKVDRVHWDGELFTTFTQGQALAASPKLVLAPGAREQILPELAHVHNVFLSSEILTEERWFSGKVVHLLGASHSAAAVIWKIITQGNRTVRKIIVYGRNPFRYYYPSEAAALADGYQFDDADVCPLTGKVNRFGGVRSPYKETVQAAITRGFVEFHRIASIHEILSTFSQAYYSREEVGQAVGYRANVIPLYGPQGHLGPLVNERGHVAVDERHRVRDCAGQVIPGAFALGLGHQPRATPALGGELSYGGPVDGFNVFAGVSAHTILEQLTEE